MNVRVDVRVRSRKKKKLEPLGKVEGFHNGMPPASFSVEEDDILASSLKYAAVGRSQSKLSPLGMKAFLLKGRFRGGFRIRRLSDKELLFIFKEEADYTRFMQKRIWYVGKTLLFVSKWTKNFCNDWDCPVVPIWVTFKQLPLHFIHYRALFTLASTLGRPIQLDASTSIMDKSLDARVLIERDVSIPLPQSVHLRIGDKDHSIHYFFENPPMFCNKCKRLGHNCFISTPTRNSFSGKENCTGQEKGKQIGPHQWVLAKGKKKSFNNQNSNSQLQQSRKMWVRKKTQTIDVSSQNPFSLLEQPMDQPTVQILPSNYQLYNSHTSTHGQLTRMDPLLGQLLGDAQVPANNNNKTNDIFPSFSEAKEYANKMDKKKQTDEDNHSHKGACQTFTEEGPHYRTADQGLSLLLQYSEPNSPSIQDRDCDFGYHSEEEVSVFLDNSKLEPRSFRTPEQKSLCVSVPKAFKKRKHFDIPTMVTRRVERRQLWEDLISNAIYDHIWIVGGDFNTILSVDEHKGSTSPNLADIREFKDCLEAIPLLNTHTTGGTYTWDGVRSRGRVWRRLDRALANEKALTFFNDIFSHMCSKTTSDHKPIVLQCAMESFKRAKPFRFQNFWVNHSTFLKVVNDHWSTFPTQGGMRGLASKLQALKTILRNWSKSTFGDIFEELKKAETNAQRAQEAYETNPEDPTLRSTANEAYAKLIEATNRETTFWKQKANLHWLEHGDQNSSFFHSFVKGRRTNLKIRAIRDIDGKLIETEDGIKRAAEKHFVETFSNTKLVEAGQILNHIPSLITNDDNNMMSAIPDEMEEFFMGIPVPQAYGSTLITLIPKKENCTTFSDFRPISLSTFMSKINTRILATRLQKLIPNLISIEQSAYQKGKGVEDHVLMASEMVHSLDRKCDGGNVIIKLDMAKAFDKIEWSFLKGVLNRYGFSPRVQNLLLANLEATYISILINGSPTGYFKMKRGVKVRNLLRFKHILEDYTQGSGQEVNFSKSCFFAGPCKRDGISLRQHILEWNLRSSSKTIRGNLKMVIAGIIAWHLWKTYNAALYNEEQPSVTKVLHNIKTTIQNWCWNNRDKR
ncbi:unnamed protein product [Cuscuta campestris]|uniref:Reverse transcriptase domain-containing protein n=1 Tax=Cuscuta campestris TaxID=132261 RepID=A0A484KWD4_9ASTE|nr:unnamed protein product [Cuscuta campestris]